MCVWLDYISFSRDIALGNLVSVGYGQLHVWCREEINACRAIQVDVFSTFSILSFIALTV